jgi:hypothetical protein
MDEAQERIAPAMGVAISLKVHDEATSSFESDESL